MKNKIIGWGLWALALIWPIHQGLLQTEYAPLEPGGNVRGLIYFVLTVVLLFAGYLFYDSASGKTESHGH